MATTSPVSDGRPPSSIAVSLSENDTPPPSTPPESVQEAPSPTGPAVPSMPLPTAPHAPNQSRWSSLLKIFQPEILIPLVIGAAIGALGTRLSQTGNEMDRQALELAKWTAEKDYRNQCEQDQTAGSLSEDCEKFIHRTLQPPPHVSKRCCSCIPNEGMPYYGQLSEEQLVEMTEVDLDILNKHFASQQTTAQTAGIPNAVGLESKFYIIFVLSTFGLVLYFVRRKRWITYQWILRANTTFKKSSLARYFGEAYPINLDLRSLTPPIISTGNNLYMSYTSPQDGLRQRKTGKLAQNFQNLHDAALHGDLATVRMLLSQGADINAKGGRYENALQAAAFNGHETVAAMLLHSGADFKAKGGIFGDALQAAAFNGHEKVVEMLLNHGADFHSSGGHYGSALHAAASEGHEKVVEMMLDRGASPRIVYGRKGVLLAAAGRGHKKVVKMLLAYSGSVITGDGNALHAAATGSYKKIVEMLLDYGISVNAEGSNSGDISALQAAVNRGHKKMVEILLDYDADADVNVEDRGVLLEAISRNHEKVAKMLLDRGTDANARDWGLLNLAASEGCEKAVKLLLDHGSSVNASEEIALHAAANKGHEKVVEMLLEHGASVNAGSANHVSTCVF